MKEDQRDQKTAQVDRYNDEANQALLKVMRGCEGSYRRYADNRNIADVVASAVNDNSH